MNIGVLTITYYPNLNGLSLTTKKLVEELRKYGINMYVITSRIPGVEYPDYVLPINSFRLPENYSPDIRFPYPFKRNIIRFLKEKNIELLHSQDPYLGILGNSIAKKLQIPHINSYHTFIEEYPYLNFPGYKYVARAITRKLCNECDLVVALTTKMERYLQNVKIKTPITFLHNVPNISHLSKNIPDPAVMNKFGIKESDFVFITFGRVAKEKNINTGIDILEPLIKKYKNIKYIIAGMGPEIVPLKKIVQTRGLDEYVIFTDKYEPETLSTIANLAHCFLFTSYTDVQPTSILEAMACGLPVISLDDDSVDYILKDGHNGIKCTLNTIREKCESVYLDQNLLNRLSTNAFESASILGEKDITLQWINTYKTLIQNSQHS